MIIPEDTTSIWFDAGLSFNAPNSVQFMERNPKGFVVGFEPDPRMYFGLFSAKLFAEALWLLDKSHESAAQELLKRRNDQSIDEVFTSNSEEYLKSSDRYIIIPAAISSNPTDYTALNLDPHHGSSGIARSQNSNQVLVANISLNVIINMIPDRYEYIDHLKVDCENMDADVIRSAGSMIHKFVVVSTELNLTTMMKSLGFEFFEKQPGAFSYVNKNKKHLLDNIDYKMRV